MLQTNATCSRGLLCFSVFDLSVRQFLHVSNRNNWARHNKPKWVLSNIAVYELAMFIL